MFDPILRALTNESHRQRRQGNHGKAAGLSMIAIGIFTLPIPIIGIPLIFFGICKLFK